MTVKNIVARELRVMFRKEPLLAIIILAIASIYTMFMGELYKENIVNYVPLVIYDQDQTEVSRALIQAFADSEKYQVVAQVLSQEAMESLMREKKAYAALSIPPDFSKNIKKGIGSEILLELNAANIVFANTIISSAQEIGGAFSGKIGMDLVESFGQMPSQAIRNAIPIQSRIRVVNNPTLNYSSFFILGVLFTAFQSCVLMAAGMAMMNEYENLAELKEVAPVKVVFSKVLTYWICGLISFFSGVIVAVEIYQVPFRGSMGSLFLLGGLFIFAIASMASLFAAFCRDKVTLVQIAVAYAVPAFMFSGYTWPQHAMNLFGKIISYTLPLTYTADNLRDLALGGYAPNLPASLLILLLFGLVMFGLSVMVYARRRKQSVQGVT
ncbi:MAG: hypothetical protein H6Q73_4373 [Firmicutes bacterium]|nr:hypothetical protein [Bacillota bacterium]